MESTLEEEHVDAPYRHIAVCVDDSPGSDRALEEAVRLRALGPGRLSVVHAATWPLGVGAGLGYVPDIQPVFDGERTWLEKRVAGLEGAVPVLLIGRSVPGRPSVGDQQRLRPPRRERPPRHVRADGAGELRGHPGVPRSLRGPPGAPAAAGGGRPGGGRARRRGVLSGAGPPLRIRPAGPHDRAALAALAASPPSARPHQRLFPGAPGGVRLDSGAPADEGVLIAESLAATGAGPLGALAWRERRPGSARAELLLAPGARRPAVVSALMRALISRLHADSVERLEIEVCPEHAPLAWAVRAAGLTARRRDDRAAPLLEYDLRGPTPPE